MSNLASRIRYLERKIGGMPTREDIRSMSIDFLSVVLESTILASVPGADAVDIERTAAVWAATPRAVTDYGCGPALFVMKSGERLTPEAFKALEV